MICVSVTIFMLQYMSNFKLLTSPKKIYQKCVKCIASIKKFLMRETSPNPEDCACKNNIKKNIRKKLLDQNSGKDTGNGSKSVVLSSDEDNDFVPLAAKDSTWVDLDFYNPNFSTNFEDEEYDEDMQSLDGEVDSSNQQPFFILFPDMSSNASELSAMESTTDITKMLVGKKANFSHIRSSKKMLSKDVRLKSVIEQPQQEEEAVTDSLDEVCKKISVLSTSKSSIKYQPNLKYQN